MSLCPIKCRITLNKKRKEFSTGLFINPEEWNSKKQIVILPDKYKKLKEELNLIKNEIYQFFYS